jgi:putative ABC transport system substrate-binding protein
VNRRKLISALGAFGALHAVGATAQPKTAPIRIGWLSTGTREVATGAFGVFKDRLAALGWKEGRDYTIEEFFAQDRTERFPELAKELAARKPALIVATSGQATAAASKAAPDTPIVMAGGADPVLAGFARSLARPGGMITGLSNNTADISEKYLELLREAVPGMKRIGFLVDSRNPTRATLIEAARRSAAQYRVEARIAEVANPEDVGPALSSLAKDGAQAIVVLSSPTLTAARGRIIEFARTHKWPVIANSRSWPAEGALMSYGINALETVGRAAYYVDRILKGAKPGDLPIEQPTRIEFVVSRKTARALGIVIPQSLLVRADEVLE